MENKLNVLFVTEMHSSMSGYSKLARELLNRLYDSGKYNLAELACECNAANPEHQNLIETCKWKIYPAIPAFSSKEEESAFLSHPQNRQGRFVFNDVSLDFQADIVFSMRDMWYETYLHYFPFRNFYNLIWWSPADGIPMNPEWVDAHITADAVFTYTDWGTKVLRDICGNKGNIVGAMPIGVDPKVFTEIPNKAAIKEFFGFKPDTLVVGFVCRNQPRKLIAMLMEAFTNFLIEGPSEITSKTFLYLHTAWPDMAWNIPQLLQDYGIGNKVLFTYQCKQCKAIYPTVYCDVGAVCMKCGQPSLASSRSSAGVPDSTMNLIYNFMDAYFQPCTNGGLEIPAIESIACGIPTFCTDYSGPVDIIHKADAIPIKSAKLIREMEDGMNRYISVPDIPALTKQITDILALPDSVRRTIGHKQKVKAASWFNWDLAANILMNYLDTCPKKDWKAKPFRIHKPDLNMPQGLSTEEFVWWGYHKIIGRPEIYNRYDVLRKTYELMVGVSGSKPHFRPYNTDIALRDFLEDNKFYNDAEMKRKVKFENES